MNEYYCTSKDMQTVRTPRTLKERGLRVEFNPNIGMYRINGEDLPPELMGYELHKTAMVNRAIKFLKRKKG